MKRDSSGHHPPSAGASPNRSLAYPRALTLFTLVVLLLTIGILLWLRASFVRGLEQGIANTIASFTPPEAILREPTDLLVNFEAAETLVANARRNPFIRDLTVTKLLAPPVQGGESAERPVVPYDLFARLGPDWRSSLAHLTREPLGAGEQLYGFLYFDLDRSAIWSVNIAIAVASFALAATLLLLLRRLYSQQTTIHQVGSELDQRTRELIRLERLALAGQLSANLLHDLKKPVLNIRHRLEDLREEVAPDSPMVGVLSGAADEISLFFQMLNDSGMERFVRSDRVSEEYVDLNDILKTATGLVHYERGSIELIEHYTPGLPPILAQRFRLVQVFSNLILNAYQAMRGSGALTIQTAHADGRIEVRITDSGPGIPPDVLPSIFEPFFTTKPESEGSGLGLAISRLIILELGGKIDVESKPGGPTTFLVTLKA